MIGLVAAFAGVLVLGAPHGNLVDTTPYAETLAAYVKDAQVDYPGLKAHREKLDAYVKEVAALPREAFQKGSREARMAYLINAYNAWTLESILDNYPKPVKNKGGFFSTGNSIKQIKGVWDRKTHRTAIGELTLDQIEKEQLLPKSGEPLVHMSLVCASKGCPPLRSEPYYADKLAEQLEDQARTYLSSERGLVVSGDSIKVSMIFKWYAKDFERKYKSPFEFVQKYSPDEQRPRVALAIQNGRTGYIDYDWTLNEQGGK